MIKWSQRYILNFKWVDQKVKALTGGPGGPTKPESPFWPCEPWRETRHHWKTRILLNNDWKTNFEANHWKQWKSHSQSIPWSLSVLQHPVGDTERRWEISTATQLARRSVGKKTYRETRRTRRTQRTSRTASTLEAEEEMKMRHFMDVSAENSGWFVWAL